MANITNSINNFISEIPTIVWIFVFIALAALIAWVFNKKRKKQAEER